MLKGIDVSHHNKWQYDNKLINFENHDFIIMKASEGRTYVDPMLGTYMHSVIELEKPYGFYHYARPENNKPEVEAKHFCEAIGTDGLGAMLILDWEGTALKHNIQWAVEWLNYVEKVFGKKPLIYTSSWYTKKLKPVLDNNNALWVAHYTKAKQPIVHTYPTYTMWQYTSEPYDKDIFKGDISQWNKFADVNK